MNHARALYDGICHSPGGDFDRPRFDLIDDINRAKAIAARETIEGPRVGDYIELENGDLHRFAHHWGDSIQTTKGGSWYLLPNGHSSYSGGLDPGYRVERIEETTRLKNGDFWFFHHNSSGAARGVCFDVPCRVYKLKPAP